MSGTGPAGGPVRARRGRADPAPPSIVLVDNYDSFTYNLAHLLLSHGCQVEVVRNDEVSAPDMCDRQPGRHRRSHPAPGPPPTRGVSIDIGPRVRGQHRRCSASASATRPSRAAYGARHQHRAPARCTARPSLITHDGGGVLAGLPRRFPAARYHSLIVEEGSLPPGLVITARGPGGIPMGLRHVTRHPVEGLQFHPGVHPHPARPRHHRQLRSRRARRERPGPGS